MNSNRTDTGRVTSSRRELGMADKGNSKLFKQVSHDATLIFDGVFLIGEGFPKHNNICWRAER